MFAHCREATKIVGIGGLCLLALCAARSAQAQGNIPMAFDALMVNNSGDSPYGVTGSNVDFGGYGMFLYDGMVVETSDLGRFQSFVIRKEGTGGSGMGFNFNQSTDARNPMSAGTMINPVESNMFPLLDRSGFGINFDPTQYVGELVFKPLTGNNGDQLNFTLDTYDGFDEDGIRRAEQWQWNFTGLAAPDPINNANIVSGPDADGYYTIRSNGGSLSGANAGFTGDSHMIISPPPPGQVELGDGLADFNAFEAFDDPNVAGPGRLAVPNGAKQIHLQTPYDDVSSLDYFAIKSLRVVKLNSSTQEVARLDGRGGISERFGSPFRRAASDPQVNIGGMNYLPSEFNTFANTDQLSRFDENGFTNLVLNTHDDLEVGGFGLYQPPNTHSFDGTTATFDVTAQLTEPLGAGQADRVRIVVRDKDGDDTAPGQGGDHYSYELLLNQFNTSTMTTVSIPLTDFTVQTAGEFVNAGDGLLTDFNLYYIGVETLQGIGVVDLEIESLRVMLPAPPGLDGDHNMDGKVDAADYALWRSDPNSYDGAQGYQDWVDNFGAMLGAAPDANAAVPEPATYALGLLTLGIVATWRRRTR